MKREVEGRKQALFFHLFGDFDQLPPRIWAAFGFLGLICVSGSPSHLHPVRYVWLATEHDGSVWCKYTKGTPPYRARVTWHSLVSTKLTAAGACKHRKPLKNERKMLRKLQLYEWANVQQSRCATCGLKAHVHLSKSITCNFVDTLDGHGGRRKPSELRGVSPRHSEFYVFQPLLRGLQPLGYEDFLQSVVCIGLVAMTMISVYFEAYWPPPYSCFCPKASDATPDEFATTGLCRN